MDKLEEAARKYGGITPDVMDIKNLRDLRTISAMKIKERLKIYKYFYLYY